MVSFHLSGPTGRVVSASLLLLIFTACESSDSNVIPADAGVQDATAGNEARADVAEACSTLPTVIEASMMVGPGCVRLTRTTIKSGTLTILPGTTVNVASDGYMMVGRGAAAGALVAIGTPTAPIVFMSANANPAPGDWQCLRLETGDSELRHVTIRHGGSPCDANGGRYEAALALSGPVRAVQNVTITDSRSHAVSIENDAGVRLFKDNRFARNGKASIRVSSAELLTVDIPNTFETPGDHIEVDTGFPLESNGTVRNPGIALRMTGRLHIVKANVTIEAGTRLQLRSVGLELLSSTLDVAGTPAAPVVFTSANPNPQPGDWGCLDMVSGTGSRITHAILEYGGAGCTGGSRKTGISAPVGLQITNTQWRNFPPEATAIIVNVQCPAVPVAWCANTFTGFTRKVECNESLAEGEGCK